MSIIIPIAKETEANSNFRKVISTGEKTQLVVMNIPVGEEIGQEMHAHVEQILFIHRGSARVMLDSTEQTVGAGDAIIVSPGTKHNVLNVGTEPLLIYTLYAPANHIDGRIHHTKTDADADIEDEEFGESV